MKRFVINFCLLVFALPLFAQMSEKGNFNIYDAPPLADCSGKNKTADKSLGKQTVWLANPIH